MSFYYYPPAPPQTNWNDYYPPYYAGAVTPPGVRLGDVRVPQPPGWSAGDIFGRGEVNAWETTFKVALVLGGIAAAYFLYKTVKEVGPPSRKVGEAAGAALVHMGGRRGRSPRVVEAEFESSPRWLTKYEGE